MFAVRVSVVFAALLATCGLGSIAQAAEQSRTVFMRVHGQALPPFGFVQLFQRFKTECGRVENLSFKRFNASPTHLSELDYVNRAINARIKPATDIDLYGRDEYWTFPNGKGDCEDYVVLKRRILMRRGWPASALLITVVRDEIGDGHAVLTVRTRQGDFVLDNKVNDVLLWNQTPYKYLMRQSYLNPKLWMALDPQAANAAGTVAGLNATDPASSGSQ